MFDILIKGGAVVDGTGAPRIVADVGINGERITAVGKDVGRGRREVDASGRIVVPGWVDIHSHYDGQATWDPLLSPSGHHGVTTTVFGNCGVGFAPARRRDHRALITLMEGVEDIPGTALSEGLPWTWESFPEYLDTLASMPRVMDVAALIPHSAVRAYVMGPENSIRGEASQAHIDDIRAIVREGIAAGGRGISTSRTKLHLGGDGKPVPGSFAEMTELLALGDAVAEGGGGMLQLVCDWSQDDPQREFLWMKRLVEETRQPLSFTLAQYDEQPRHYRRLLDLVAGARKEGLPIHAGVAARPVGMLINLESKIHPFSHHPSYAEVAHLPLADKLARMRNPDFRGSILAEESTNKSRFWQSKMQAYGNMYELGESPDYEPSPETSIAVRAARTGHRPAELIYDIMTSGSGVTWLYFPFINYADRSLAPLLEMMRDPGTVLSLADGGAHCGLICDASSPTFMLTHWTKSRTRGPRLSLEEAIYFQTGRPAAFWGFPDRGQVAVGKRADLNIIDLDQLRLLAPRWAADLPAGGSRLLQDAVGYDATFVAGRQTWSRGEATGERPGRLVRRMGTYRQAESATAKIGHKLRSIASDEFASS